MSFRIITPFVLVLLVSLTANAQKVTRKMSVTIDDLPVVSTKSDLKSRREITKKLLAQIKSAKVPVIGFVNEGKLYANGKRANAEIDLLRAWLAAGHELGNHTYSHMSLHDNPLETYKADILKGEIITNELLTQKGETLRFFRHPYLWTGLSLDIKADLGKFLAQHGYTIAPVSIDNSDWIFARAYDNAFDKADKKLMKEIGDAYVPYLTTKTEYWERQSVKLFGREIQQIMLLHANRINSVYFKAFVEASKKRGYEFVTLEESLKDEAYKLPDNFIKRNGISWLHRWAIDRGKDNILKDEPATPAFVLKAAGIESE